jgi:hypothetical protein
VYTPMMTMISEVVTGSGGHNGLWSGGTTEEGSLDEEGWTLMVVFITVTL